MAAIISVAVVAAALAQGLNWDSRQAQELAAKQSLRNANLPQSERAAIAAAIEEQLKGSVTELHEAALDTRVLRIDLNRDGQQEIIAQPVGNYDCSPTGNCSFWVFQKSGTAYKLLLNGLGQTFTLQPNYTNGFQDIVVAMHGSAFDSTLKLYRYERGRYLRVARYDASWQATENPDRLLKAPRITSCRPNCGC